MQQRRGDGMEMESEEETSNTIDSEHKTPTCLGNNILLEYLLRFAAQKILFRANFWIKSTVFVLPIKLINSMQFKLYGTGLFAIELAFLLYH